VKIRKFQYGQIEFRLELFLIADDIASKELSMRKRLIFATMFVAVFTTSIFDMMLKRRNA